VECFNKDGNKILVDNGILDVEKPFEDYNEFIKFALNSIKKHNKKISSIKVISLNELSNSIFKP
jgi:hypothetical protein